MAKAIVVVGFGPGISTSVARKFGSEGFSVALIARNEERLASGVEALKAKGITAAAFPADAGNPAAIREAIAKARKELGPISVMQWNAHGGNEARDLVIADPAVVLGVFDIAIVGLLAAIQEVLPDLREAKEGAVLVTNGAAGEINPQTDAFVTGSNPAGMKMMGVAVANAAKDKLVGMLAQRLKDDGVYVGQVMIAGTIKGTAWDAPNSIDPSAVAEKFWELYLNRDEIRARMS
jgi:NADP-dependent 3-hydroxy acid dehydrogenase YdfG